jgi:hypothetical protein
MKKTLSTLLRERTDTIEFRAIRKALYVVAQNSKCEYRTLSMQPKTITMLENNGITIEKVNEHGYETYKLTW